MFKIPFGRYIYRDSFLHKLNPIIKIFLFVFLSMSSFFINSLLFFIVYICLFLILSALSRINPLEYVKKLKVFLILFLFIIIFQSLFSYGRILFSYGVINVTYEGVFNGLILSLRLALSILFIQIFLATTSPVQMVNSFVKIMTFLKIPYRYSLKISLVFSLSMNFISVFNIEIQKIYLSQKARGAFVESTGFIGKIKQFFSVIFPLFILSLNSADEIDKVLKIKGYERSLDKKKDLQ